ncbi:hypothetical protein [Photobacterium atrarenae]|uniref:Uncharacterized protein n=1 Tax=Photobacterium atrarenae TaxID=865757 RepID=A0ABY5GJ79_9GAMM|nr:hypothetical protein [Photobacterium atrarenae]UTV29360.1 hypothetical protein NNL38_07490 [Photobacterium atrarenae]
MRFWKNAVRISADSPGIISPTQPKHHLPDFCLISFEQSRTARLSPAGFLGRFYTAPPQAKVPAKVLTALKANTKTKHPTNKIETNLTKQRHNHSHSLPRFFILIPQARSQQKQKQK